MILVKISSGEANQRFDKYLKKLLKNASDSFIYKMLRKKNIVLNGKKASGKEKLCIDDEIKLFLADDTFEKFSGNFMQTKPDTVQYEKAYQELNTLAILYEDEHILIANKPSGVLAQKAKPEDISVNEWLIGYLLAQNKISPNSLLTFKPSVCNRLDRNTSGIIVCGKSLAGSQYLSSIIKDKTLEKYYYCLVAGEAVMNERITGYLYKDTKRNKVTVYSTKEDIPNTIQAETNFIDTSFHSVNTHNNITLLEVQLFTGKTHQIRAHLAALGHPILGDVKYGNVTTNRTYAKKGIHHQMLHAHKLIFPTTSDSAFEQLSGRIVECPPPFIFKKLLEE